MSTLDVLLKGPLAGMKVTVDGDRRVTAVTKDGKTIVCKNTSLGWFCDMPGPGGAGGGAGPVLQLRVTPKRVFARTLPPGAGEGQRAARRGFQRHNA